MVIGGVAFRSGVLADIVRMKDFSYDAHCQFKWLCIFLYSLLLALGEGHIRPDKPLTC